MASKNRKIFIGSSSEAEKLAADVVGDVIHTAGMEPIPWRGIFPPGMYPLEVFERILPESVAGAVFLVTPDVFGTRGSASFESPVANVILEYGYLAARLGRTRVVVCEFDGATQPSDLLGVTVVKCGKYEPHQPGPLPDDARTRLGAWMTGLPQLAEGLAPVRQVHGYSGQWKVKSSFSRWKGRPVGPNEEVVFNGTTALCIERGGTHGTGMQRGILHARLEGYEERRRVCNEVQEASVNANGTLRLTLKVFSRDLIQPTKGKAPQDLGYDWLKSQDDAPPFYLVLEPDSNEPKRLRGGHDFQPGKAPHHLAEEDWTYSEVL